MNEPNMVTVVLKIPQDILDRLSVYAHTPSDRKFLMLTGIQDYLYKREARTRRAILQRAKV
jgi:hypothetical protein